MKRSINPFLIAPLFFAAINCSAAPPEEESSETATVGATDDELNASYVGCYTDNDNRALPVYLGSGHDVTSCTQAAHDKGFRYAGLQYYGECWAGGSVGYSKVSDQECNTPCSSNPGQTCGGAWRNSIYDTGGGSSPSDCGCGGDMTCFYRCLTSTYEGCYSDTTPRALPVYLSGSTTVGKCIDMAAKAGYRYAGLQYYGQCFAGNSLGYTKVSESQCNTRCSQDQSMMCGGAWRNSIYRLP